MYNRRLMKHKAGDLLKLTWQSMGNDKHWAIVKVVGNHIEPLSCSIPIGRLDDEKFISRVVNGVLMVNQRQNKSRLTKITEEEAMLYRL